MLRIKEKAHSVKFSDQLLRKKHRSFKENISKCPVNKFIEMAVNDMCINSKCNRGNGADCVCQGRFKFACSQFCTLDKKSCSKILGWMNTRQFGSLKFYKC